VHKLGFLAKAWRLGKSIFDGHAPARARILALLTLVYLVNPIDPLPDIIPILGWLDDLGVLTVAVSVADRWLTDPKKRELPQIRPA